MEKAAAAAAVAVVSGNCCHMTFDLASDWRIYNLKQVANKADERPKPNAERAPAICCTHTQSHILTYTYMCVYVQIYSCIPSTRFLAKRSCQYQSTLSSAADNDSWTHIFTHMWVWVGVCVWGRCGWQCVCMYWCIVCAGSWCNKNHNYTINDSCYTGLHSCS